VVAEHAVQQVQAPLIVKPVTAVGEQPLTDDQVAEQAPLGGDADLGAVGKFPCPTEVVDDRGGEQEIGVELGVQLAGLVRERGDRDRVLEQAAR